LDVLSKVVCKGWSWSSKDVDLMIRCLQTVIDVRLPPVTRLGWDDNSINIDEVAGVCKILVLPL
jgi:hypothetical protein